MATASTRFVQRSTERRHELRWITLSDKAKVLLGVCEDQAAATSMDVLPISFLQPASLRRFLRPGKDASDQVIQTAVDELFQSDHEDLPYLVKTEDEKRFWVSEIQKDCPHFKFAGEPPTLHRDIWGPRRSKRAAGEAKRRATRDKRRVKTEEEGEPGRDRLFKEGDQQ